MYLEKATGLDVPGMKSGVDFKEKANWKPRWIIEKYDENMNLYESEEVEGNLLLNEGINSLLKLLVGSSEDAFNNGNAHIGVGDGTVAASASQTGLVGSNKTYRPMDATYPKVEGTTVTFRSTFGPDFGNHKWREFTVSNGASDSAKNLNRLVEAPLREKVAPDTWVMQLQVTIS